MKKLYKLVKRVNTRVILSSSTILVAVVVVVAATFAFLSDTETSEGNTFAAGVLDLQIDNTSYYNGVESPDTTWELDDLDERLFFDFHDLKPGDWGEDTISIHVIDNDAWACFEPTLTTDDDNGSNEPELLVDAQDDPEDDFDGELGSNIEIAFWVDDGDNVLEEDEMENIVSEGQINEVFETLSVTLADSIESVLVEDGEPLSGAETYYIAKAWCFGDLSLTPVGADQGVDPTVDGGITCDGTGLGNVTQTDRVTADITFATQQARNNPDFVCNEPEFSCTEEDVIFASSVVTENQGLRKDGTAVLPDRSDSSDALGAPQSSGDASDTPVIAGSFFSLGFPHDNNSNTPGSIELDMGEVFYPNPDGADLQVFEVTGGVYPDEIVDVEVSLNGVDWTAVGNVTRDGGVEIAPLTSARYVRLTENSDIELFEETADGYDLDAVQAFCTVPDQVIQENQEL